ncbi:MULTISPECIES: FimV/HubP family polar landmark protein [Brachymonas]|uniref:FimV/HubP family polar landmark protein n=1 Tax=Brachymonas TaxID=28219 RepID=UPI002E78B31E|nr:FimV/HubP family polar landmark protein [Brachymonas sp. J145]MEE1653885.1 FimV/HubP family polar landmark protein [Brachymonas sp. J145]
MLQTLMCHVRPSSASALLLTAALGLSAAPAVLAQTTAAAPAPMAASSAKVIQTRPGAMVSRIASANRPAGATLDQTLLAILRVNPDAFMADNINLLKKGAALTMPTAEQALSTPADEARVLIRQQHADYEKHGYGLVQLMAAGVAASASASASTSASASATVVVPATPAASAPAQPEEAASSGTTAAVAVPDATASASVHAASAASAPALVASDMASAASAAAPAAVAEPASQPVAASEPSPAPVSESAPASDSLPWWAWTLIGVLALLVIGFLLLWRAAQRREAERLAAEAAAAAGPRASAEALSRAMDLSQPDHVPALEQELVPEAAPIAATAAVADSAAEQEDLSGLTLELPDEVASPEGAESATSDNKPLVFDFSNLSLDIEGPADLQPGEAALLTKLALAREFLAISDLDGARVLAQEVADKTDSDSLKAEADALLARIAASSED